MPKSGIPSPARSHGSVVTPRRYRPRGRRSLGSPARSDVPGRLTSVINMPKSFILSPMPTRRSVLADNTDIEEPKRRSWWRQLGENSREVMDVIENNKISLETDNVEELIEMEVLSQEKKCDHLDLPESSRSESIHSIIMPQRKLFNQKENEPQKNFGEIVGTRETLPKLHKSSGGHDKSIKAGTRNIFQSNKPRNKPIFPAALLDISLNKTDADITKELNKPTKTQVRNIFGNRAPIKRRNMFAEFIVSESEDEIPEIEPKVFGFTKKIPDPKQGGMSKGKIESSPNSSITTDMEMDDWRQLPSSTMFAEQLVEAVFGTPVKRPRLSKLSEAKESDVGKNSKAMDKTEQSHKSVFSKNRSKNSSAANDRSHETNRSMSTRNAARNMQSNMITDNISATSFISKNTSNNKSQKNNTSLNTRNSKKTSQIFNTTNNRDHTSEETNQNASKSKTVTIEGHHKNNLPKLIENNENNVDTDKNHGNDEINFTFEYESDHFMKQEIVVQSVNKPVKNQEKYKTGAVDEQNQNKVEQPNGNADDACEIVNEEQNKSAIEEHSQKEMKEQNGTKVVDNNGNEDEENEIETEVQNDNAVEEHSQCEVEEQNESEPEDQSKSETENQNETKVEKIYENADDKCEIENEEQNKSAVEEHNEKEIEEQNGTKVVEYNDNEDEENEIETEAQNKSAVQEHSQREVEEKNESEPKNQSESETKEQNDDEVEQNESQVEGQNESEVEEQDESAVEQENETDNESEVERQNESEPEDQNENESEGQYDSEVEQNESEVEGQNESDIEIQDETSKQQQNEAEDNESETDEQDESVEVAQNETGINVNKEQNIRAVQQTSRLDIHNTSGENGSQEQSADVIERTATPDSTGVTSLEAVLHDKTNRGDSFIHGRITSIRKSKSIIRPLNIRPSLEPPRNSIDFTDGSKNSSTEGSGWDSHRTTRKTLRQTFGKDFTPRKSLRALVMEKSAKRQTACMDERTDITSLPQANSTEFPEITNHFDMEETTESEHELSRNTRQANLEMRLKEIKKKNIEEWERIGQKVRNMFTTNKQNNRFKEPRPYEPPRPKKLAKPKTDKHFNLLMPTDYLPAEILEDMKYKPPKRFKPNNASWITKRLYKFLETKLEPKYDYKARVRAEKLVETIYNFTKGLKRQQIASQDAIDVLKHEMARLNIVKTHIEFDRFFKDYMPREVRIKVVPDIVNKIPLPSNGIFSDIIC